LGEAYYNQPADVMNAIQTMRNRAINAGTLKDTPQQKIEVQPAVATSADSGQGSSPQQTVIIQPAQPTTVYVPQYNPATVYGAPVQSPPGYTGTEMLTAGLLSFGVGMLVGSLINDNHNDWNCNWGGGSVHYNNNVYVSRTTVVPGRGYYPPGGYPPGRYPAGGYPPGRYPAGAYPRPPAGNYPRPYPATRPAYNGATPSTRPAYNGAVPATRPYDKAQAKQFAANNPNLTKPNFPQASTLPNNPSGANPNRKAATNRPAQPANLPAQNGNRPTTDRSANNRSAGKPAIGNFDNDPKRGYGANSSGAKTGALGGVEPGGLAQASSDRGRASMGGRNNRQSLGGSDGGKPQRAGGGGGRGGAGGGGGGGRKRR
jgi:hypothetical protein